MRSAGTALALAIGLAAQDMPLPQPTFRTRVDLVQVDVSVLDVNRRPARGLTAADFTVFEDGKPRPIVSFQAIDLPAPHSMAATGSIDAIDPDTATNAIRPEGRLVVLLLDWTIRPGDMPRARAIAKAAVSQLGPGDLAAVIYNIRGVPQDFTSDRGRLLAAIDRPFVGLAEGDYGNPGECYCGTCTLEAMVRVAEAVREAPQRHKMLLFIGDDVPVWDWAQSNVSCDGRVRTARERVIEAARLANMRIHALDPRGLEALGSGADRGAPNRGFMSPVEASRAHLERQGNLASYPANTGGRVVVNTNAPAASVSALFDESASYYLLAFAPASPVNDGRLHTIEVKVADRTLSVHARRGYLAGRDVRSPSDRERTDRTPGEDASRPLEDAIAALLPRTGLELTAAPATFASGNNSRSAVLVTTRVRQPEWDPGGGGAEHVEVLARAFDPNGSAIASQRQRVDVTVPLAARGVEYEIVSRLHLKPGHYEIRVAVHHSRAGRTGSVYAFVDVPDFQKEPLSLSGVVLEGSGDGLATPKGTFDDVLPVLPTGSRTFERAAHTTAFARVYQAVRSAPRQTVVNAVVVNAAGHRAFERTLTLEPGTFGPAHAADARLDLPLAALTPGDYLLTIDAIAGDRSTRRQVRFTVR